MSEINSDKETKSDNYLKVISDYYSKKIDAFGPTPKGVDWKNHESQTIRLEKIAEILPTEDHFSLNDLGCGYGELAIYLKNTNYVFTYSGYDLSEKMIMEARKRLSTFPDITLINSSTIEFERDYSVASGIFSVKADIAEPIWEKHIYETLRMMNQNSTFGFSFNLLSTYSDLNKRKEHLYYADPNDFLLYCLQNFSWNVRLDHSYDLYEFTISVLKEKR